MPINQLNIRTKEIDEILGKTPNSIIRWGVSVIFTIIVLLLIGSWFFKYPDFVRASIEITTLNLPSDVVVKSIGQNDSAFMYDNVPAKDTQVIAIASSNAENTIGKILLSVKGASKVKTGQRVHIKLDNYPYMEFGTLEGIVKSKSFVTNEGFYYIEIIFPYGTRTSYGVEIPFLHKMYGSAEIVTDDIRLLNRIFQPVKSALTKKVKD